MAKNTQPIAKRCKALGISPAVMGYAKKNTTRNSNGNVRKKQSEYASQLKEKQKVKFIYGVLEKQFHNAYLRAEARLSIIQRVISDNPFATYTVFITELGSCQTLPVADLRMIGIAHCHNPVVSYRQLQLCGSCFYISFAYRMRRQQHTVTIKNIHVHFMNLILKDLGCTVAYITELQQAVARTVTHIFFDAPVERS